MSRQDLEGRLRGTCNALRRVADCGHPCRYCGGPADRGASGHARDCPAAVAAAALRLEAEREHEGSVTGPESAAAYLLNLHHGMAGPLPANAEGQGFARGVIEAFQLCGVLAPGAAGRWVARIRDECPERGLHDGGCSWCNYCGDVCADCGRPYDGRRCLECEPEVGDAGADPMAAVGDPGGPGGEARGNAVLGPALPAALPTGDSRGPAGPDPGAGLDG